METHIYYYGVYGKNGNVLVTSFVTKAKSMQVYLSNVNWLNNKSVTLQKSGKKKNESKKKNRREQKEERMGYSSRVAADSKQIWNCKRSFLYDVRDRWEAGWIAKESTPQ